jgi:hypothetical protein
MNINARDQGSVVGRWQPAPDSFLPGCGSHSSGELVLRLGSPIQSVKLVTDASS